MQQSGIPLNELLRISFTKDILWLSGEELATVQIDWVTTELNSEEDAQLFILPTKNWSVKIGQKIKEKNITALLLVGKQPPEFNSKNIDIPCAFIQSELEPSAIQRNLISLLLNKQNTMTKRGFQIHEQLTKMIANNVQIDGLARAMQEITGRSVLIQNKRLQVIAEAPSANLQSIWSDMLTQFSATTSLPPALKNRKASTQQNMILSQDLPGGISRIITPIVVGEMARGYLSIIGMSGTIDTLDQIVAREGALVCAVEMAHAKALRTKEKVLQSDLLTALLQEDLSPRDAGLWIEAMGLDPAQRHSALQFAWDSESPPSLRRLETLVNGEVARLGLKVVINPTGNNVICFCQLSPDTKRPDAAIQLGQQVIDQAKTEYSTQPNLIRCGIGASVSTLNHWHLSFKEAGQALKMAFRLKEDRPLYYPALSLYRLLLLLEDTPELESFHQDILGKLLEKKESATFIDTLDAYFEQSSNISQTARVLFIHRNTLTYRLERIAEITGLDLDNPETMLTLQLALKIHRMLPE